MSASLGQSPQRPDVLGKVTGDTRYGGDLAGPEVLSAVVIRSPHPHARILGLDLAAARELPGVVRILTVEDIAGTNVHGLIRRDQAVFCTEKVRYRGDALGVVVATTQAAAEQARDRVVVRYEPLPIVGTMSEALAADAVELHECGNVLSAELIRKGDAEQAIAAADVVVHTTTRTQAVDHAFLDVEAGYAELVDDRIEIHASGQWVHEERRLIAMALGVPLERLRIIQPPTGGAFGGREDISIQIYLGLAVMRLGRAVRIQYTRHESMVARHKRHPMEIDYTLAAKADGTITAAKVMIRSDEGAYASTGPAVLRKAVSHATGPYRVPNISVDGIAVFTNNCPTGAMRGFGACQLAIAYEGAVRALAERLGMDIVELKRNNLLRDGDAITTGQIIPVASAIDCMDAALSKAGWATRDYQTRAPHLRRGWGVSTICFGLGYGDGFPDASRARVRIDEQGVFEAYSGAVEVGQGVIGLIAQIVAEELGLDPLAVRVIAADTLLTPEAGSSSATRQTMFTGNAVKLAASELKVQLLDAAALHLGLHSEELALRGGAVVGRHREVELGFAELIASARARGFSLDASSIYQPRTIPGERGTGRSPRAFITYMFGSHVAQVLVDTETGEVVVERIVAAHDVGRAINPREVAGQIEGGVAQGLGMALMEEVISRKGEILNPGFTDYIIPTIVDVPPIDAVIVERADLEGPYGARGVGEPPLIGTVPAILAAIGDAIGRPVYETPATSERVWAILHGDR
ncbi:xanthine dehydrogenase family protein molybdopterin-binding subunit [Nannocystaceae bacterium ST9]